MDSRINIVQRPQPLRRWDWLIVLLIVMGVKPTTAWGQDTIVPLPMAHAHNDYEHDHPLADALSAGFCSVEADVFVVNNELLVAHDLTGIRPGRTLEALYLAPLRERAKQHAGRIYPNGPVFTLLIDFKSAAEPTYVALVEILEKYRDILDVPTGAPSPLQGAVQAIISGNRPIETVANSHPRRVAIDGRIADLTDSSPRPWMPLISDRWSAHFTWDGTGDFPADERVKLDLFVQQAHAQHRRLRFWATPDEPKVWQVLADAQVDLINTDRLADLAQFLRSRPPTASVGRPASAP